MGKKACATTETELLLLANFTFLTFALNCPTSRKQEVYRVIVYFACEKGRKLCTLVICK